MQNWFSGGTIDFIEENNEIIWRVKGDVLAGRQIEMVNLVQEPPADAPGRWLLSGNNITGTMVTPFIKLCPERSFKAVRIESISVSGNELRLVVLDATAKPVSDAVLPGNSEGIKKI